MRCEECDPSAENVLRVHIVVEQCRDIINKFNKEGDSPEISRMILEHIDFLRTPLMCLHVRAYIGELLYLSMNSE